MKNVRVNVYAVDYLTSHLPKSFFAHGSPESEVMAKMRKLDGGVHSDSRVEKRGSGSHPKKRRREERSCGSY